MAEQLPGPVYFPVIPYPSSRELSAFHIQSLDSPVAYPLPTINGIHLIVASGILHLWPRASRFLSWSGTRGVYLKIDGSVIGKAGDGDM
jgi:hypothetical protein